MVNLIKNWQQFYKSNSLLIDIPVLVFYGAVFALLFISPDWLADWGAFFPLKFLILILIFTAPPAILYGIRFGLKNLRFLINYLLVALGIGLALHWSLFVLFR